jgi:hypothetical protein
MARCEVCGNDYYLSFQVVAAGHTHTFDSFECAIHKLAPVCDHCGCKIIGHGIEAEGTFFCCAHCAQKRARADHPGSTITRVVTLLATGCTSVSLGLL